MAVTYNLGFNPFWYFPDLTGKALVGGYIWSYESPNHAVFKPIYSDSGGTQPYPNPMPIDGNGLANVPLYFADDTNYFLQIKDGNLPTSTVLYEIDKFNPSSGGSSPPVTTFIDLTNFVTNGQFSFNMSPGVATPITTALTTLAPSNHSGLTTPDIVLRKNNFSSTESYQFVPFNQGDSLPTLTPRYYLNYICSLIGSETQKDIEFPISAHVRTLENTSVTFSFWAQSSSSSTIEVFCTQYFGDGDNSPSAPASSTPQPQVLSPTWTQYYFTIIPPNTSGKTIGNCGNDYLVMTIRAPLSQVFNISVTNVMLLNVTGSPPFTYNIQDHTDAIINSPRTGDVKLGYDTNSNNNFARGWLLMDDSTIGASTSTATHKDIRTFPLYNFLYNNVLDAYAPVSGGRSGNAALDFAANKTMKLTTILGRALASAGSGAGLTPRPLGSFVGEETHVLSLAEMPAHNHPGGVATGDFRPNRYSTGAASGFTPPGILNANLPVTLPVQGADQPHNNMEPTSFINVFIKL